MSHTLKMAKKRKQRQQQHTTKKTKRKLFIYIDDTCGWNVEKSMIHGTITEGTWHYNIYHISLTHSLIHCVTNKINYPLRILKNYVKRQRQWSIP